MYFLRLLVILIFLSCIVTASASLLDSFGGESVVVTDVQTGNIIYQKNPSQPRPVGSTQKLLTALIIAESDDLNHRVVIQSEDENVEPTSLHLKPGTSYTRHELLQALLVKSANDIARALARDYSGSIENFAIEMNKKAVQLGALSSHFVNPNGLPAVGQYSTAYDMAKIARAAYENPTIRSIVAIKYLNFRYANGKVAVLTNTNRTLRENWFCTGMKTGYTEKSKHCLITSGVYNNRVVISVILGTSKDKIFIESSNFLKWALGIPMQMIRNIPKEVQHLSHSVSDIPSRIKKHFHKKFYKSKSSKTISKKNHKTYHIKKISKTKSSIRDEN